MRRRRGGGEKTKKRKKTEVKWYEYRAYGCRIGDDEKEKAHKSELSNYCILNVKSKHEIALVRETCLSSIAILETGGIGKLMIN